MFSDLLKQRSGNNDSLTLPAPKKRESKNKIAVKAAISRKSVYVMKKFKKGEAYNAETIRDIVDKID